ncbi:hypothetical protein RhiJN_27107 [Ceratobasidium sp. AG-Ba]|nr:hypothetical protein RhiJN_27107 [Ceratobasidium sp. AG-Ba]
MSDIPQKVRQDVIDLIKPLIGDASDQAPAAILWVFYSAMCEEAQTYNTLNPDFDTQGGCRRHLEGNPKLANTIKSLAVPPDNLFQLLKAFMKPKVSPQSPPNPSGVDRADVTSKAWDTPYLGNADRLLEHAIHDMNRDRGSDAHANFVPIVQSSGTGKSRAVDQVARRVFTIPFNLRESHDMTGFPPADPHMNSFILPQASETTSEIYSRYFLFFHTLFECVALHIQDLNNCGTPQEFAYEFYKSLRDTAKDGSSKREHLYKNVTEKTNHAKKSKFLVEDTKSSCKRLIQAICKKSGVKWDSPAPDPIYTRPVRLLIYFDEAHTLTKYSPIQDGKQSYTAYQLLCRVLNNLRGYDLFGVFISTNSRLSRSVFTPPQRVHPSARVIEVDANPVQVPFVELAFDLAGDTPLLKEGAHSVREVCRPAFMVRFGRPLYWTRFQHGDLRVREDIIRFAEAKLRGVQRTETLGEWGVLAFLSQRLGLTFTSSREEAKVMEDQLINGNQRIAYSVPSHREYVRSGTPSEPILAEAAAQLMARHLRKDRRVPRELIKWLEPELIAKGERVELVARYLLTRAHDIAVEEQFGSRPELYTYPVRLSYFLESLFGKEQARRMLKARPSNQPGGLSLQDSVLGSAVLNFTHWTKAGDDGAIKDKYMWSALARSMAWQCCDNQVDIDLVTPLALSLEGLNRQNVSAIYWQVKNRGTSQKLEIDAEELGCFSPTGNMEAGRPYITITMDLGTNSKSSRVEVSEYQPDSGWYSKQTAKHARYAFVVTGCDHEVFPEIIQPDEKAVYDSMLASKDLLADHPRPGEEFIKAVVNLKPMWWAGSGVHDSYSGVEFKDDEGPGVITRFDDVHISD